MKLEGERVVKDQRRLSAIVSADVAGYSRLMGGDEGGTLLALKAHRHDLIDPKIAEYGGRIVKTTGDGLLLEFPSVVDAVRCAVDVQRGMHERNTAVPAEERIEFRVGINLGDIIIDGDDIFGDGVNVAARLQTLAQPGEICVDRAVRDQVVDKLGFGFEKLGARTLKNIARPVEVFRIRDAGDGAAVHVHGRSGRRGGFHAAMRSARRNWPLVALVAMVVAGAGVWLGVRQLERVRMAAQPAPFSVAVMPFTAATGSPGEAELSSALTERVAATLGGFRFTAGNVAPTRSVLEYKDRKADARDVGRALGVRYLIDGTVRATAGAMNVSAQVIDAGSGASLSSMSLAAGTTGDAGAAATTARKLSTQAMAAIEAHEMQRAATHPVAGSPLDLVLASQYAGRNATNSKDVLATRHFLDDALRIDPDYQPALQRLASMLEGAASDQWSFDAPARARFLDEADKVSLRAVKANETSAGAWTMRAQVLIRMGRFDEALAANAKAMAITEERPDVSFLAQRATILEAMDRPEEALAEAERARTLPPDVGTGQEAFAIRMVCKEELLLGRYRDATELCERSAALGDWWVDHMWLAASYAQLGDTARAGAEAATLKRLKPDLTIARLETNHVGNAASLKRAEAQIYAGLRKAGVPER